MRILHAQLIIFLNNHRQKEKLFWRKIETRIVLKGKVIPELEFFHCKFTQIF